MNVFFFLYSGSSGIFETLLAFLTNSLRGFENVTQLLFAATFGMYD